MDGEITALDLKNVLRALAELFEELRRFPTDRDVVQRSGMPVDDVGRTLRTLAENEMITERSEGGHRVVTRVTRVGVAFASET
ncbi:hypothetical protein [Streptacidiphilus melanogenes]|uniref:hypothetical protein n=1 Tax=Streptacidiphilus melanogenes TaxID=411235 RepID=UPI0005A7FBB1|nr:hypothetical protein [Streptacidiphilus melanogenes]